MRLKHKITITNKEIREFEYSVSDRTGVLCVKAGGHILNGNLKMDLHLFRAIRGILRYSIELKIQLAEISAKWKIS